MKRRKKLADLALLGISLGILASSCNAHAEEKMTPKQRSFYEMLDEEAKKEFLELDPKHREAAVMIIEQYCKAAHECSGLREKSVHQQYELQKMGK